MTQDRLQWQVFVITTLNLRVPNTDESMIRILETTELVIMDRDLEEYLD
jgi:hypothetical protein